MDHSQPQCGNGEQNRRYSGPTKSGGSIANDDGNAALSPHRHMSMSDNLVVSPASSSIGSPSRDFDKNGSVLYDEAPINPFRFDFDEDRDESNYSTNSQNLSRVSLASSKSNAESNATGNNETQPDQNLKLDRVPSLNLSVYSGYDTDEDEDGVLRRFHDQARSSLQMTLSLRSDDDESVYSAVNTSTDIDEENLHRNNSDASISRSSSSHGENNRTRKKKKKPTDHIKDAIHGMRKAHRDAQRLKSTRRFLAMSEGNRTAQSFTEAICLSPWCDFSYGRGLALMMAVLCFLVGLAITLSKFGHLAGGIWTCALGITILLVRRFWVPIYWLVWGQFVEKRRRRNMQLYDSLNGERTGGIELSVQDSEVGFNDEEEFGNASSEPASGELT